MIRKKIGNTTHKIVDNGPQKIVVSGYHLTERDLEKHSHNSINNALKSVAKGSLKRRWEAELVYRVENISKTELKNRVQPQQIYDETPLARQASLDQLLDMAVD